MSVPVPASLILATWPTPLSPRRSAWPPSGSSCPCSRTIFDPAALGERLSALETEMGGPGFWDDPEAAAKVGAEHTRLQRRLESFGRLEADAADLGEIVEMAEAEPDLAGDAEAAIASVEARLSELEEQRLFTGDSDAGDALVTVNAAAAGTDAQDWAEMVLRMEMRWAERRGFKA